MFFAMSSERIIGPKVRFEYSRKTIPVPTGGVLTSQEVFDKKKTAKTVIRLMACNGRKEI
jgi:hypothetical protein